MKAARQFLPKIALSLIILVGSGALLNFALLPKTPIHSREVTAAYARYAEAPSAQTKRTYEDTLERVNRPWHLLEYASGLVGIALLFVFFRVWRTPHLRGQATQK